MAPQEQPASGEANSTTSSTSAPEGQEPQGQQPATPAPGGNGQQQEPSTPAEPVTLPDDHPLVVRLAKLKESDATQRQELQELRAKSAKATQLEEELGKRPTTEAMDTLQNRYDRLEEFVLAVGLGKALDSRTFTKDLFESDKDINALVKDWNKANPSATSQALGAGGAQQADGKRDPNELLRIAAGKA